MSSGAPGNSGGQQQFPQMQAGQQGVPSIGPQQNRPNVPVHVHVHVHTLMSRNNPQQEAKVLQIRKQYPLPMTAFIKQRQFVQQQQQQQEQQGLQQGM